VISGVHALVGGHQRPTCQPTLLKREAEVAVLRHEGKETHEIAAILGIKESTVRVTEFRIRNKIKKAG
jgi:DNA-binding NarL/FixJ family response regulator